MSSFSKYGAPALSALAFIVFMTLICLYYICYKPRRRARKAAQQAEENHRKTHRQNKDTKSSTLQNHNHNTKILDSTKPTKYATAYADHSLRDPIHSEQEYWSNGLSYCIDLPCDPFTINYLCTGVQAFCPGTPDYYSTIPNQDARANGKSRKCIVYSPSLAQCKPEYKKDRETIKRSSRDCLETGSHCKHNHREQHSFQQAFMQPNHSCCRLDPCNHQCFKHPLPCIQELTEGDSAAIGNTDSGYED